ncbi:uncharacterized protein [Ptychodera flava]|uniref:uncharacterized protein n=1 Tax=Ptychodera flava TaxID=63121 RepID=UPI00396A2E6F
MNEPEHVEHYEKLFPVEDRYDPEKNQEYKEAIETADDRNEPPLTTPFPIVKVKKRKRKLDAGNEQRSNFKAMKGAGPNDNTMPNAHTSNAVPQTSDNAPKTKTAEDRKLMAQKMREKRRMENLAKKKEADNEKARLAAAIANRKKQLSS